jgi:hypothetical protein
MNIVIIISLIFVGIGIVATALYFLLRKKDSTPNTPSSLPVVFVNVATLATVIRFQTTCDIKFILIETNEQGGQQLYENLLFSPKINYSYNASELARDMTNEATVNAFPMLVSFENGIFTIFCTDKDKKLLVVDREYDASVSDLGISQYGAAQRFLNHLYIDWPVSYFPSDVKTPVKEVQSKKNLTGMIISLDPVPNVPTNLESVPKNYSITINWIPTFQCKTGIFLKIGTSEFQNWDLIDESIGTYTFESLPSGPKYTAGISAVGTFDESSMLEGTPVEVLVPLPNTLVFIDNSTSPVVNSLISTPIYNSYAKATTFSPGFEWPDRLTKTSQILNIKIKYYMQLISYAGVIPGFYPTLPSDSRIEVENGATANGTASTYSLLDYMYWKTVTPNSNSPAPPPNVYIFGSTDFPGTNQGGPSLPWQTRIITNPGIINAVFPSYSNGDLRYKIPPNLRFFCGYLSNQIVRDTLQVPIALYSIDWKETV